MSIARDILVLLFAVVSWQFYIHNSQKTQKSPQVSGYFHPAFRKVAEVFKSNVESGLELGAAFAVYHKGEVLVDMWGGWADIEAERHWQEDTMAISFSMVKGVSAIVMARLVDMGLLDYNKEVYHYWPEFASQDKKNVTVGMLLSHQAGLIGLDEQMTLPDYRDNWEKLERLLATQKPKWPPGTAVGYHALTYGMYADALVRKVDPKHRNISQFWKEEIAEPLDIEFYIGLPLSLYHRYARLRDSSFWEMRYKIWPLISVFTSPYFSVVKIWPYKNEQLNNPELLAIGHPSAVGVGPARSLAKLYDYLANGGSLKAKRLLSPELTKTLQTPIPNLPPNVFLVYSDLTYGLRVKKNKQGHDTIGHSGLGGNNAFADISSGLGIAYSTNHLGKYLRDDPRETSLVDAFYEGFETYKGQAGTRRGV